MWQETINAPVSVVFYPVLQKDDESKSEQDWWEVSEKERICPTLRFLFSGTIAEKAPFKAWQTVITPETLWY